MYTFDSWNICELYLKLIAGLAQDCSNSIANALELLQSCTKQAKGNGKFHFMLPVLANSYSAV